MNILVTLHDNRYKKSFDISQVVSSIKLESFIEDNPTKVSFNVLKKDGLAFWEGATISIVVDSIPLFKGFVFQKSRTQDVDNIQVVAYDALRYLKNKDTKAFSYLTSSQIVELICKELVLPYKIVDNSSHICAPRVHDAVPFYEMAKTALHDTLINSKEWFILRDNFGTIEHVNVKNLDTGIILGDKRNVSEFSYVSSIDTLTANQVKLYRDNTATGKREVFIVNDTINGGSKLREWGLLQAYEKVSMQMNSAQVEQLGLKMLEYYNNTKRNLRLSKVLGHPSLRAGNLFNCRIADLGDISLDAKMLIKSAVHYIDKESYVVDLQAEVV